VCDARLLRACFRCTAFLIFTILQAQLFGCTVLSSLRLSFDAVFDPRTNELLPEVIWCINYVTMAFGAFTVGV